ncbi:MAG: penicillin-binding protein 1A, partial [Peptococcaceae bacterium]|nr:penicillin-binding protein 1A [Peptococcaceae bacterium]
ISESQYNQAVARELKVDNREPAEKQYPYPYFLDYVTDLLIDKYGEAEVFKGGLRVYTTLDPKIQQAAEDALARAANFPSSKADAGGIIQPQGAIVVTDPRTGYIKALVGGREHTQKRQWNRATQTARQPGSAFKPIAAYGPAIEYKGMGPASVVDDAPVRYGSYEPRNNDGAYRGLITLRSALASSVNVVAVKLLMDVVSIPDAIRFANGLGINLDPSVHGASMALGGLHTGVTPLQMAGAYAAFANNGIYIEPTAITRVERADGVILEQTAPKQHRAMKATTAYLLTDMLKTVIQSGTGTGAQIGRPAAGKTGTTDDGKDIWFVGYTPELVASVWIGYDQPTAMPYAYGGTYPARIWQEVMSRALRDVPVRDFPRPDGIVTATVDGKSGLLPGPNSPADGRVTDLFAEGTVPAAVDNVHVFMEVCAASGQLPNEYCPDRVIRPVLKLPYNVPSFVQDYSLRAPTETCTLHGPGTAGSLNPAIPGAKPKDNGNGSGGTRTGPADRKKNG